MITERDAARLIEALESIARSAENVAQALRAAVGVPLQQDPAPEHPVSGWRDWPGGFSPLGDDDMALVWVKRRSGKIEKVRAGSADWRHYRGRDYVIAWQPV